MKLKGVDPRQKAITRNNINSMSNIFR
jgi:hypothetical protein